MVRERHLIMGEEASPEQVVSAAQKARHSLGWESRGFPKEKGDSRSIAYTYTEPTICFEYTYDTARLAHEAGLANIYVTNGYMTEAMLETLHPYLDAANVDLKAFQDETYREYVGARLQPVLDTMKVMKRLGIWLEVTTLVIPGINDDDGELKDAADFVADELGVDTPWHISRFLPDYKMTDVPPTPIETLHRAQEIGLEAGLRYVYVGNVPGEANTRCHKCGQMLIRRSNYRILQNHVQPDGRCPNCGMPVAGVEMG
jgi:pyruvate formate lyase activating enzyme